MVDAPRSNAIQRIRRVLSEWLDEGTMGSARRDRRQAQPAITSDPRQAQPGIRAIRLRIARESTLLNLIY